MSRKIVGYIEKSSFDLVTGLVSRAKIKADDIQVEIKVIDPIYEYLVLYKIGDAYDVSDQYYKDKEEFVGITHQFGFDFVQFVDQSKRIRKGLENE